MLAKLFRIYKILGLIYILNFADAAYVLDFYDEFSYDCVDASVWTIDEFYNETLTDDRCFNFTIGNQITKEFFSPNYPDNYPDNITCYLTIIAPTGFSIKVEFQQTFHLEQASECKYDSLEIFDGRNSSANMIRKLCSNVLPGETLSSGQYLFLKFRSDHSNAFGGFRAKYSFVGNKETSTVDYVSQENGKLVLKINQFKDSSLVRHIGSHVTNHANHWNQGLFEISALLPLIENITVTIELISANYRINFVKYRSENRAHEFITGVLPIDTSITDSRLSEERRNVNAKLFRAKDYNKFTLEWLRNEQLIWRINGEELFRQNISQLDLSNDGSFRLSISVWAEAMIKKIDCTSHVHIDYVRVYQMDNETVTESGISIGLTDTKSLSINDNDFGTSATEKTPEVISESIVDEKVDKDMLSGNSVTIAIKFSKSLLLIASLVVMLI